MSICLCSTQASNDPTTASFIDDDYKAICALYTKGSGVVAVWGLRNVEAWLRFIHILYTRCVCVWFISFL